MITARFRLPVLLLIFTASLFTPSVSWAKKKDKSSPALLSVCKSNGLEDFLQELPDKKSFSHPWERRYGVLVFDSEGFANGKHFLYWNPAEEDSKKGHMVRLYPRTFTPIVYTTETVLVLVCNSKFGDGYSSSNNSITITPGDQQQITAMAEFLGNKDDTNKNLNVIDRLYLLDSVTDNTLTQVNFSFAKPTPPKDDTTAADDTTPVGQQPVFQPSGALDAAGAVTPVAPPPPKKKPKDTPAGQTTPPPNSDVVAWALIERHRTIHYSIGGGFVTMHATPTVYSAITTPTTVTTLTCIAKLTTVTTNTTSFSLPTEYLNNYNPCLTTPPNPFPTNATSYESNITTATATGTANYAQGVRGSNWQVDALVGVTVYPFGRDTYTINERRGFAVPYGFRKAAGLNRNFPWHVGEHVRKLHCRTCL